MFTFKQTKLTPASKTFFIAEIGSTHCASLQTAKKLIDLAEKAGVDCVKFQKRDIQSLLTKKEREREYKSRNAMAKTYGKHREVMEFSKEDFQELFNYATKKGLFFSSSAWDRKSVDFLLTLPVPFLKIASADLNNLPLLRYIASKKVPVVLSTGMGTLKNVIRARKIFQNVPCAILQCTSSYPTPSEELNLRVIQTYQELFPQCLIGYSGHDQGLTATLLAVALGAKIIEKHVTFDKNAIGSDHKAALDGPELIHLIQQIRLAEKMLGSKEKKVQPSEKSCILKLTKSVTSAGKILKGTPLTRNMLTTKSPGYGIPADQLDNLIGKVSLEDIPADVTLTESMIGEKKSL